MAWCPFAVHRPLSENHTQGSITPRAVILHTAVSSSNSLFGFFQNNSDLESHFYVTEEGVIEQYMDTGIRADANKNANGFAVSIETEDGGQIRPWTDVQLAALIRLVAWICDTHDIPKRQIPDAYGSGIGWHVQFGAPGPWTPVSKSCPGGPRIEQAKTKLIPAVASGAVPGEDELDSMDRQTFEFYVKNGVYKALLDEKIRRLVTEAVWTERTVYRDGKHVPAIQELADAKSEAIAARAEAAALEAALAKLPAGGTVNLDELRLAAKEGALSAIAEYPVKVDVNVSGPEVAS